jgi:putative membrane protein
MPSKLRAANHGRLSSAVAGVSSTNSAEVAGVSPASSNHCSRHATERVRPSSRHGCLYSFHLYNQSRGKRYFNQTTSFMKTTSTILLLAVPVTAVLAQIDTSTADSPYLRHSAQASPPKMVKMSDKDVQFISQAGAHNESEMAYGKMAEQKAQSVEVKKIAARIVSDHTRMNKDLVAFVAKKGVKVTTGTVKAESIPGKNFDKAYLQMVQKAHQDDIALYEKQAKSGNDADLRAWAAKNLPMLKAHLAMVRDALKNMK